MKIIARNDKEIFLDDLNKIVKLVATDKEVETKELNFIEIPYVMKNRKYIGLNVNIDSNYCKLLDMLNNLTTFYSNSVELFEFLYDCNIFEKPNTYLEFLGKYKDIFKNFDNNYSTLMICNDDKSITTEIYYIDKTAVEEIIDQMCR